MAVKVKQHKGKWWVFIDHKGKRKAKCVGSKQAAETAAKKIEARLLLGNPPLTEEQILQAKLDALTEIRPAGSGPCVYFLQAHQRGPMKIGFTHDLARRVGTLRTGSPSPLRVVAVIEGGTPDAEAELHATFVRSRIHGEWFRLTKDLVEYIITLRTTPQEGGLTVW